MIGGPRRSSDHVLADYERNVIRLASKLRLERLTNASKKYKSVKALFEELHGEPLEDVEELIHWAVNEGFIDSVEGDDILEFYESGELFGNVKERL